MQITAASCVSATRCVAVDDNADVLASTDPTGGPSAWAFDNLIPYGTDPKDFNANAMFGVSCPSASMCAIAGARGKIFTLEDPFAPGPAPVKKKRKRRGPKRPRVTIAASPQPDIRTRGGKAQVRYRFYANGKVRRFKCKIDKRPFKNCRSPKAFRVGPGKHLFRVRATGLTGLKGPVAKDRFRAWTPSQWPVGQPPPSVR